jgi:hypothetical protein
MTTWQSFRTAVEAAVTNAMPSGVRTPANNDGPSVFWADGAMPYGKHLVQLSEVSVVYEHDRDTALYTGGAQSLSSFVAITVQVQCESQHDDPTLNAQWLIEQIRLGLRKVSAADALRTANVLIVGWPASTVRRSYPADGRQIPAHSFDVTFRTEFTFDATGEDAGLVERAVGEGDDGLDGADIDVTDPDPEP